MLALRLAHVASALTSPLAYQLAPDEGYYLEFGKAVAAGLGSSRPEFLSLDPGYGYLLGMMFKVLGANLFAVFLLQALVDTGTAYGLIVIGRLVGRPRAGWLGAAIYGLTSTALMYSAALLKEVWVASFVTWWVAAALALARTERRMPWLAFGVYCGAGIALRANLLLLAVAALALPWIAYRPRAPRARAIASSLVALGLIAALSPWSARNAAMNGGLSPLPHNGGISLHQVYNVDNPRGEFWIPPFVSYMNPGQIWRGYANEARARAGRDLSPVEIDHYWRDQALEYIETHPAQAMQAISRKAAAFLSSAEIPDNRSTYEERLFSPLMRVLPRMTVVLVALGLAGLVVLVAGTGTGTGTGAGTRVSRGLIVALPILTTWATVAVFFDADRFRFHAVALLALAAGVWVDGFIQEIAAGRRARAAAWALLAVLLAAVSLALGAGRPPPAVRWDQIAWGYVKMGQLQAARETAQQNLSREPANGDLWEVLGFTAIQEKRLDEAAADYRRALELRPRSHVAHYNLAKIYLEAGDREHAAAEARRALELDPLPEYLSLAEQIERGK